MSDIKDIDPVRSNDLDRRSFLRTTGMLAAATMTGGLPFRAIAEQSGATSSKALVKGTAQAWDARGLQCRTRLPGLYRYLLRDPPKPRRYDRPRSLGS